VLNPGEEDTPIDAKMLPKATIWQFATRDGGIDVLHEVPGGRPYGSCGIAPCTFGSVRSTYPWSTSTT
jgi:hypothetical protein